MLPDAQHKLFDIENSKNKMTLKLCQLKRPAKKPQTHLDARSDRMAASHRSSLTFHSSGTTEVPPGRQGSSAQGQFPQEQQNSCITHYTFQKAIITKNIQRAKGDFHKLSTGKEERLTLS